MPFKNQETPYCPHCGHAGFQAESVSAAGKQWHKTCLTCGLCKKMIETTTMVEHVENEYCKQCYAGKFGIRGVEFGIEDGALGMDTGDHFIHKQFHH
ncbi:unnamed protein product [Rotaria socialis]|uniref:LIM zinc-binding domain-containing protein n=1 Tax=Rotaria socialis TaxID=392032 RepID=A0A820WG77_9BILA|nr:unnamed protein product [Rotaria socialis]CAF4516422.1 unnamed protein product [Rotaria socialis]